MTELSILEQRDALVAELQARMSLAGEKPRYGVIGTGMMGREHLRAILQLDQAVITGICDSRPESLALAEAEFAVRGLAPPTRFASAEAMALAEQVDALFICTPNFTHRAVFDQVAPSGKPVFLEKPMATTLADALYLAEQCRHYPAPIQVGMQYRFKSQYQLALNALAAGNIGAVHMISLCEYRPPFLGKVNEWNKFTEYSGGTLVEKCCHYFDLLNRIAGSLPARVYASGGRAVNFLDFEREGKRSDIDDHAMVIVEYENGIRGQFTLNMFARELYEELIVGGAHGMIRTTEHASFQP
ncbi:MAG: Gfo/Idh/MocA family oxidoreductase, partial [Proteobacteria bacterium]|nr:Gfo/Idh/MocA family oxidoreductase [Pseudomonadota bacterium]